MEMQQARVHDTLMRGECQVRSQPQWFSMGSTPDENKDAEFEWLLCLASALEVAQRLRAGGGRPQANPKLVGHVADTPATHAAPSGLYIALRRLHLLPRRPSTRKDAQ
jgi:hypothetical protein